jgi:hypothetical protein
MPWVLGADLRTAHRHILVLFECGLAEPDTFERRTSEPWPVAGDADAHGEVWTRAKSRLRSPPRGYKFPRVGAASTPR